MRIAMFGHKRIPSREGGIEIVVQELSSRMAKLGHEVTCYNRSGHHVSGGQFDAPLEAKIAGVRCKTVPTIDRKGFAAVTSSVSAAWASAFSKADVVHIHAEGPAFMCWLPKLMGKRVVVTIHGLDWRREKWKQGLGACYIRAGEKMAVRCADEIIVLSENMRQYFRDTYGRESVRIPNGVNQSRCVAADRIRSAYGLEQDAYILYLGRLVPEKGIHYLIEAFKNTQTDHKLVIAGGASDSDAYVQQLKDMAQDDPRVIFTGFVQGDVLEELYSNAYLYVLPSDVEGMPLTLLEAMSYGNCCLVSDIPEHVEVVETYAQTFPQGDKAQLREKLQRLCDQPETVAAYRRTARSFICGKYNWDDVVEKTLALYQNEKQRSERDEAVTHQ